MSVTIACDRQGSLRRVATWRGKALQDLLVERLEAPDLTGAVVVGLVGRQTRGQKAFWLEAGAAGPVYVEAKEAVRSGQKLAVRITAPARQGKAARGVPVGEETEGAAPGMLRPPPPLWLRALRDLKGEESVTLVFQEAADRTACEAVLRTESRASARLAPVGGEALSDELFAQLCAPRVALPGGASLVIEETEALVALDVNAGEQTNPLAVNLQAVREAARQIRWRNLAGILLLDALKMPKRSEAGQLLKEATKALADDPAAPRLLGLTRAGLLEITRPRRGPSLGEALGKVKACPQSSTAPFHAREL